MTKRLISGLLLSGAVLAAAIPACATPENTEQYFDISLEDLMQVEITSVSKTSENMKNAPAAVYVLTGEDIRRMGVTSIAEALRIVPGLQVTQMNSRSWGVSSRGFNNQFVNDLLVMIDGREIYTPLFSGVYWDTQDFILEDIDRIEVIRGPGATLWGANAVNGVINIITKESRHTQGNHAAAWYGNYEQGSIEARRGGELGKDGHYRIYAKHIRRGESYNTDGSGKDDTWHRSQAGFRIDHDDVDDGNLTLMGDIYHGEHKTALVYPNNTLTGIITSQDTDEVSGGNLVGKWYAQTEAGNDVHVQLILDHYRRNEGIGKQEITSADAEFQHTVYWHDSNTLVWGVNYRAVHDDFEGLAGLVTFNEPSKSYDKISGFFQNATKLMDDDLILTMGTKLEQNEFTGFEYQPSAKLAWSIDHQQTLWGAVSRAVRTPSRIEDSVDAVTAIFPGDILYPASPPGIAKIVGSTTLNAETLTAYEVGYRFQHPTYFSLDLAAYYNRYRDLFSFEQSLAFDPNTNLLLVNNTLDNQADATSYGGEIAANLQVMDDWKLTAGYAFQIIDIELDAGSNDVFQKLNNNNTPKHQFSLRSSANFAEDWELDNMLYYVDNIYADDFTSSLAVPDYFRFDTRIGWRPMEQLDISLVGQNLLDGKHPEFAAPVFQTPGQVGRSYFARLRYRY